MTPLTDVDAFLGLQKSYPRGLSNDTLLPGELRELSSRGMLSYTADERALFLYERREGCLKLRFRLRDEDAQLPPCGETITCYLPYREGERTQTTIDWLQGQGFRHLVTLERYTARQISGDLSGGKADRTSAEEAYAMILSYFSPAEADLPPREYFGGAYCCRSEEGIPQGMLADLGRAAVVCVSPEARGHGIGGKLYLAYAAEARRKLGNPVFHEWIRPDNKASQRMFGKLGFVRDGVWAEGYVLKTGDGRPETGETVG